MTKDYQGLQKKYENAGQGHVFTFFEQLSTEEQNHFLNQLTKIDVEQVIKAREKALESHKIMGSELEPLPKEVIDDSLKKHDEWYELGLALIKANQVAVILMAGGQGTRLGSDGPKGCYDIDLPSKKSLFQLQAERIYRLQKLATGEDGQDAVIPWYIMTSGPTDKPTREFFAQHNYFGLKSENVIFFQQGVMPCFDLDGKFMLEGKGKVIASPIRYVSSILLKL